MSRWLRIRLVADRIVAAVVMAVVAPVVVALGWLVRRHDGGPALIRVPRMGQHGRPFRMWKLRSMRVDTADGRASGPSLTGAYDDRITPIGRRLRAYHLDELPQLLNVAAGEMLLLGPRPEAPEFVDADDPAWRDVLSTPPGIAGPTQLVVAEWERRLISQDETGSVYTRDILPVKLAIDRWYLRHGSPATDALVAVTLLRRFLPGTEAWTLKKRVYAEVPAARIVQAYHASRRRRGRMPEEPTGEPALLDRPLPNRSVWTEAIDDELVVYDALHDWTHHLNASAARIWARCDGTSTIDEIARGLARESGADEATVLADVEDLTLALETSGALVDASDPVPEDPDDPAGIGRKRHPFPLTTPPDDLHNSSLDDIVWAYESPTFAALDFRFQIRTADPALGQFLATIFEPLRCSGPVEHRYNILATQPEMRYDVFLDEKYLYSTDSPEGLPIFLASFVNRAAAESTGGHVLLHGSAVERDGRVLAMVGRSGSGKTTLAAGVVEAGHGRYVTDEIVAVDLAMPRARPYPKALHLEESSWELFPELRPSLEGDQERFQGPKWFVDPRTIGPISGGGRIAAFLFPTFVAGATIEAERLRPAETLHHLASNAFNLAGLGPEGFATLAELARVVPAYSLTHGDLPSALDACNALLQSDPDDATPIALARS